MEKKSADLFELGIEELEPRIEMAVIPAVSLRANAVGECYGLNINCSYANCAPGCPS